MPVKWRSDFIYRKSLAERLEAQEDLNITGDKGNMGNKELTFSLKRVSHSIVRDFPQ